MTKKRTKKRFALVFLTIAAMVGGGTAAASHIFDDVDDGAFYASAVDWAADNGITTGTSATTFEPGREVSRGEAVVFLGRYNTNVVEPALAGMYTKAEVDAAVAAAVAATVSAAEVDAAVAAGVAATYSDADVDAAVASATDSFGGIHFAAFDVRLDRGETEDIVTLDGASITVDCVDNAGSTGMTVTVTSLTDGWFMPFDSSSVFSASDTASFLSLGPTLSEDVGYAIDGFSVITTNDGYVAIDGETTTAIRNSSVHPDHCIYRGMVQWSEPPA